MLGVRILVKAHMTIQEVTKQPLAVEDIDLVAHANEEGSQVRMRSIGRLEFPPIRHITRSPSRLPPMRCRTSTTSGFKTKPSVDLIHRSPRSMPTSVSFPSPVPRCSVASDCWPFSSAAVPDEVFSELMGFLRNGGAADSRVGGPDSHMN